MGRNISLSLQTNLFPANLVFVICETNTASVRDKYET